MDTGQGPSVQEPETEMEPVQETETKNKPRNKQRFNQQQGLKLYQVGYVRYTNSCFFFSPIVGTPAPHPTPPPPPKKKKIKKLLSFRPDLHRSGYKHQIFVGVSWSHLSGRGFRGTPQVGPEVEL